MSAGFSATDTYEDTEDTTEEAGEESSEESQTETVEEETTEAATEEETTEEATMVDIPEHRAAGQLQSCCLVKQVHFLITVPVQQAYHMQPPFPVLLPGFPEDLSLVYHHLRTDYPDLPLLLPVLHPVPYSR